MRIFVLCILFLFFIGVDVLTKWYFDEFAWKEYCHTDSLYQVTSLDTPSQSSRLIGSCAIDSMEGGDYYGRVYKDTYTPIFSDFLGFQLSYNRGIAFSFPITGIPLQIITILLIIGLIVYYVREEYPKGSSFIDSGYLCILSGACSHAFERIYHGYVVDFISLKYFAIFNIADILISIGAILIFIAYAGASRRHR